MERRTIRLALAQLTNAGNRKSNLENSLPIIPIKYLVLWAV